MILKPMSSFINFLIPKGLEVNSSQYFRDYFKVCTLLTTGLTSVTYAFVCQYLEYTQGVNVCIFLTAGHIFLLTSLKHRWMSDQWMTNFFGVMVIIGLDWGALFAGGANSPVLFWFISALVVSFWFNENRIGMLWLKLILINLVCFYFLEKAGFKYPVEMEADNYEVFMFIMVVGIMLYLGIVFKTFATWRESTIKELNQLNLTKDRIMAMVGHDLNNTLFSMRGFIDLLKKDLISQQRFIDAFEKSNLRMKHMIDNMLVLERIETNKLKFSKENILVKEMMESLSLEFTHTASTKEIILGFEGPNDTIINCDKNNLERILTNLISNALKYTPPKKSVIIKWGPGQITVHDEGLGFTPDQKEKLFNIYTNNIHRTIYKNDESNGIGLYIVKHLTDALNIKIGVDSPGKNLGTTFTLTFN